MYTALLGCLMTPGLDGQTLFPMFPTFRTPPRLSNQEASVTEAKFFGRAMAFLCQEEPALMRSSLYHFRRFQL
jgi:hypothetical protein